MPTETNSNINEFVKQNGLREPQDEPDVKEIELEKVYVSVLIY